MIITLNVYIYDWEYPFMIVISYYVVTNKYFQSSLIKHGGYNIVLLQSAMSMQKINRGINKL